ncbi:MAG: hypothetical protein ACRDRI_17465 [Pseudonocardiaceae bacterium]
MSYLAVSYLIGGTPYGAAVSSLSVPMVVCQPRDAELYGALAPHADVRGQHL